MAKSKLTMPYLVGVRLTQADREKLTNLCAHAHRDQGDMVRILIHLAEPVDVPIIPVRLAAPSDREERHVG